MVRNAWMIALALASAPVFATPNGCEPRAVQILDTVFTAQAHGMTKKQLEATFEKETHEKPSANDIMTRSLYNAAVRVVYVERKSRDEATFANFTYDCHKMAKSIQGQ